MEIFLNDQSICTLTATQEKVLKYYINSDILNDTLAHIIEKAIYHEYNVSLRLIKEEWAPQLRANGIEEAPLDDELYAQLVFSQPNYKDRKTRDLEAQE